MIIFNRRLFQLRACCFGMKYSGDFNALISPVPTIQCDPDFSKCCHRLSSYFITPGLLALMLDCKLHLSECYRSLCSDLLTMSLRFNRFDATVQASLECCCRQQGLDRSSWYPGVTTNMLARPILQ